jgi:Asp/Glu/hydantoin racemase
VRIKLILNGPVERYAGGAGQARLEVWSRYCRPGTELELGHLPGERENGAARSYEFGVAQAAIKHATVYPGQCVLAEREGFDAVIMHCASDPGLAQARRLVSIPVVGPGEATLRAGAIVGRAIGMTVPSDASVAHHWRQIQEVGVQQHVIGVEPVNAVIGKYSEQDPEAMTDALVAAAHRLVARGADVICPTGLALIPVRVSAAAVSRRIGVPVIDPALVAVRLAETMVDAMAGMARPATVDARSDAA